MEMKRNLWGLLLFALLAGGIQESKAQSKTAADKTDIEYEAQFDDPYDVNKMWLNFYPFYADAFKTNFNVGFGGQVNYLWKNKFDFHAHARSTYARFSDFSKLSGEKNSAMPIDNTVPREEMINRVMVGKLKGYRYLEIGGTYHFKDEAESGESKIVVYTNRYSDRKWASTVPEYIKVPSKVRKIMGIRAGAYYWGSSTNLGETLDKQKIQLISSAGDTLQTNAQLYTNLQSAGFYAGFKMMTMRNVVVKPKKYDATANDMIFSAYADIMYAPLLKADDVTFRYKSNNPQTVLDRSQYPDEYYSVSPVKVNHLGFRLGMEGMFNRDFAWTYGAEMGYRPSLKTRGFYTSVRVGFSFASRMQQKRQAYQVESKK